MVRRRDRLVCYDVACLTVIQTVVIAYLYLYSLTVTAVCPHPAFIKVLTSARAKHYTVRCATLANVWDAGAAVHGGKHNIMLV